MHSPPEKQQKVPRKPKETFRKDQHKRQRPDPQPYEQEEEEEPQQPQTPKKKRVKKAAYSEDDMAGFVEFMSYRNKMAEMGKY
jgi:hypothetical protein